MNMKKIVVMSCILSMTSMPFAFSASNIKYTKYNPPQAQNGAYMPPLYGRVVIVPAGASFPAVTSMELSSANLTANQSVTLTLQSPYYYNNVLIAPQGSVVQGTVVEVKNAKRTGKNARLRLLFTSIQTPYGQNIPITGVIKTTDNTGTLVGGTAMDTTKEYAKDIAIGSGAGAVLGVIGAAVSGGSIGQGAALMTAVGAGGGLAKSLWDKGGEIVIPANSQIDIQLSQPATISVSE